jgi:hypothetical protein
MASAAENGSGFLIASNSFVSSGTMAGRRLRGGGGGKAWRDLGELLRIIQVGSPVFLSCSLDRQLCQEKFFLFSTRLWSAIMR